MPEQNTQTVVGDGQQVQQPVQTQQPVVQQQAQHTATDTVPLAQYQELQRKLGEQGNELGELRKTVNSLKGVTTEGQPAGQVSQTQQPAEATPPPAQQEVNILETMTTVEKAKLDESYKSLTPEDRARLIASSKGETPQDKLANLQRSMLTELRQNTVDVPDSLFSVPEVAQPQQVATEHYTSLIQKALGLADKESHRPVITPGRQHSSQPHRTQQPSTYEPPRRGSGGVRELLG